MELSFDDQVMLYNENLLLYKRKPSYITFRASRKIEVTDLESGDQSEAVFDQDEFKPISTRLGFINICDTVISLYRIPMRKYSIGLNSGNIQLIDAPVEYPKESLRSIRYKILRLTAPQLVPTIKNQYPSFAEALDRAIVTQGACAFSSDMAIANNRSIIYKTKRVGSVNKRAKSSKEIVFKPPFAHLVHILTGE